LFLFLLFLFFMLIFILLCFFLLHIIFKFKKGFSISLSSFNKFKVKSLVLVYLASNRHIDIKVLIQLIIWDFYEFRLCRSTLYLLCYLILKLYFCSWFKTRLSHILLHHFLHLLLSQLFLMHLFTIWITINWLDKLHLDYEQSHNVSLFLFIQ
jgi:hypothetical protein